jgi:hypothetical protein
MAGVLERDDSASSGRLEARWTPSRLPRLRPLPVNNKNAFNINRFLLGFSGYVGTGDFDRQSTFDQEGSAFLGGCFVPRTYEVYGRTSALTGPYGTAQEYGGGLNWYLNGTRQNRLTVEGLYINRSPILNFIYPYRAGFTGMAIQTQHMVVY